MFINYSNLGHVCLQKVEFYCQIFLLQNHSLEELFLFIPLGASPALIFFKGGPFSEVYPFCLREAKFIFSKIYQIFYNKNGYGIWEA